MTLNPEPEPMRTRRQIEHDGGHAGARIVRKGRTGEEAIREYEKDHGKLDIPAYKRRGNRRHMDRERFSDN